jgi:hypothetical protein
MKKAIFIILCPLLAAILYSCDEFIEKDLEGKNVTILAPADSLVTSNAFMTFWWEAMEGALEYNVQVVSPSFALIKKLWADSIVAGNKFELALVPGSYQWRIKGMNGSSESNFVTLSFTIDSTLNITNETIILQSPDNDFASNKLSQIFKWNKLYNADEYRFQITNSSNSLLKDATTRDTENSFEFTADGNYTWSVRGQNEISNTLYSSFTITIDTEKPGRPSLRTPSDKSVITGDSIPFLWVRIEDSGSRLYDSLYVFRDKELMEKVISRKTDKTFYNELLEEPPGIYYWYVKTCDVAGNIGEKSTTFEFTKSY